MKWLQMLLAAIFSATIGALMRRSRKPMADAARDSAKTQRLRDRVRGKWGTKP